MSHGGEDEGGGGFLDFFDVVAVRLKEDKRQTHFFMDAKKEEVFKDTNIHTFRHRQKDE